MTRKAWILPAGWTDEQARGYIAARAAGEHDRADKMLHDAGWSVRASVPAPDLKPGETVTLGELLRGPDVVREGVPPNE